MRDINKIIIHCSATKKGQDIGAKEIRKWHMQGNGWSNIGYHYVIKRDGELEKGRPLSHIGAHCKGENRHSIGICLVGGLANDGKTAENNFTKAQFATLNAIILELKEQFKTATIHGHREFAAKDCPSFDIATFCTENGIS